MGMELGKHREESHTYTGLRSAGGIRRPFLALTLAQEKKWCEADKERPMLHLSESRRLENTKRPVVMLQENMP